MDCFKPRFSIIAVQGLGADLEWTWRSRKRTAGFSGNASNRVIWLKDLLPAYFLSARIVIYAYSSERPTYSQGIN